MKAKRIQGWMVAVLAAILIIPAGWLLVVQLEGEKPVLEARIPETLGRSQSITLNISDDRSGLRDIRVEILKDGDEKILLEKTFPSAGFLRGGKIHQDAVVVDVNTPKLGISDGPAVLRIELKDYSWRKWWHGNQRYVEKNVSIDTRPPRVEVLTRAHNVYQGGTGLVVYRLSENCRKSGVFVGENFFPGHRGYFDNPHTMLAFFALNYTQGPGTEIYLNAVDDAGNPTKTGFYHYIKKQNWRKDTINLPDRFLNWKMPEFDIQGPQNSEDPMLDKFLVVNGKLRKENAKVIQALAHKSENKMYWEDEFLRLPNSARRAGFADHREYLYKGKVVDHQVHLGIDLASLKKSPVPAANTGKVIFADTIGIYGKTVVLDHGFGLMSMYSHLSGLEVETGQLVARGDILGRTGTTGLAGGDHLHFSMIVHNTMVNPIEWWDGNWIMHNVTDKLKEVKEIVQ